MGVRRWTKYQEPQLEPFKIGKWPRYAPDGGLVNAAIANYAETRRNNLCFPANVPASITWNSEDDLGWSEWFRVPIGQRLVRQGYRRLKIFVHAKTSVETVGHTTRLLFQIGDREAVQVAVLSTTKTWETVEITLRDEAVGDEWLIVSHNADAGNVLYVYTISMGQPGDSTVSLLDTNFANCKLGDDDYPDSALARKIARDNVVAVRNQKTCRANVFNHFFYPFYKQGSVYGSGSDDLGTYKVFKRAGMETVKIYTLACKSTGDPDWTCKVTFNGDTDEFTVSATSPTWYLSTFTLTGSDITDELEAELKFDGKEGTSATYQYLPGWIALEDPGDVSHTVPDIADLTPPSIIESSTVDDIRTTMAHLWEEGGACIIGSDWRSGPYLYCDATTFDKTDFGPGSAAGPAATSTCARCMVFPSTSSQRIRIRMGFHTIDNGGTARVKHITIQISDSETFATWDDVHPAYEDNTDGAYQFTHDVDSDEGEVISCELDINSADWESHGTGVPLQIWISAKTDNADEYVGVDWVEIGEVVLQEDDFP